MDKVERWVCGFDLHFPHVSMPTFNVMMSLIRDIKPDGFIFGGDQMDNECISHHTAGKPIYRPQGKFVSDERRFDALILRPLEIALGKAQKVWMIGNHDGWEYELVESSPELDGAVDRPTRLNLKERGWHVVEEGGIYRLGKLMVKHGDRVNGGGANKAKRAVEDAACSVLMGHSHSPQMYTRIASASRTDKWQGYVAPILGAVKAGEIQAYMKNVDNAWQNGFVAVELWGRGYFNVYLINVIDGKASYGGKLYRAGDAK